MKGWGERGGGGGGCLLAESGGTPIASPAHTPGTRAQRQQTSPPPPKRCASPQQGSRRGLGWGVPLCPPARREPSTRIPASSAARPRTWGESAGSVPKGLAQHGACGGPRSLLTPCKEPEQSALRAATMGPGRPCWRTCGHGAGATRSLCPGRRGWFWGGWGWSGGTVAPPALLLPPHSPSFPPAELVPGWARTPRPAPRLAGRATPLLLPHEPLWDPASCP